MVLLEYLEHNQLQPFQQLEKKKNIKNLELEEEKRRKKIQSTQEEIAEKIITIVEAIVKNMLLNRKGSVWI